MQPFKLPSSGPYQPASSFPPQPARPAPPNQPSSGQPSIRRAVIALRGEQADHLNPHRFTIPDIVRAPRSEHAKPLTSEEVHRLLDGIPRAYNIRCTVDYHPESNAEGHPQGARTLTYLPERLNDKGRGVKVTAHINADNALAELEIRQLFTRTPALPGAPAEVVEGAIQGAGFQAAPTHRPGSAAAMHMRRTMEAPSGTGRHHASLPQVSGTQEEIDLVVADALSYSGLKHGDLTANQQHELSEAAAGPSQGRQDRINTVLTTIQVRRRMDEILRGPQTGQLTIAREDVNRYAGQFLDHYHTVRIEGARQGDPSLAALQVNVRMERQQGYSCAQHAINAALNGPFTALVELAAHEAHGESNRTNGREATIQAVEGKLKDMYQRGVFPETVIAHLQAAGIPVHSMNSIPVTSADGRLQADPEQMKFLDQLAIDRLILQTNTTVDDRAGISHYVAFHRYGEQWVLLDSLRTQPEFITPYQYLREVKADQFTAIWPQNVLELPEVQIPERETSDVPQAAAGSARSRSSSLSSAPPSEAGDTQLVAETENRLHRQNSIERVSEETLAFAQSRRRGKTSDFIKEHFAKKIAERNQAKSEQVPIDQDAATKYYEEWIEEKGRTRMPDNLREHNRQKQTERAKRLLGEDATSNDYKRLIKQRVAERRLGKGTTTADYDRFNRDKLAKKMFGEAATNTHYEKHIISTRAKRKLGEEATPADYKRHMKNELAKKRKSLNQSKEV